MKVSVCQNFWIKEEFQVYSEPIFEIRNFKKEESKQNKRVLGTNTSFSLYFLFCNPSVSKSSIFQTFQPIFYLHLNQYFFSGLQSFLPNKSITIPPYTLPQPPTTPVQSVAPRRAWQPSGRQWPPWQPRRPPAASPTCP